MPGLVKLGATERDPSERLSEANAPDTWRPPEAYVVACATEVNDPFAVERAVHAAFAARRVHPRREFFRATTVPHVHSKLLGRNTFAKALNSAYPNIGPHRNTSNTVTSMYLLR